MLRSFRYASSQQRRLLFSKSLARSGQSVTEVPDSDDLTSTETPPPAFNYVFPFEKSTSKDYKKYYPSPPSNSVSADVEKSESEVLPPPANLRDCFVKIDFNDFVVCIFQKNQTFNGGTLLPFADFDKNSTVQADIKDKILYRDIQFKKNITIFNYLANMNQQYAQLDPITDNQIFNVNIITKEQLGFLSELKQQNSDLFDVSVLRKMKQSSANLEVIMTHLLQKESPNEAQLNQLSGFLLEEYGNLDFGSMKQIFSQLVVYVYNNMSSFEDNLEHCADILKTHETQIKHIHQFILSDLDPYILNILAECYVNASISSSSSSKVTGYLQEADSVLFHIVGRQYEPDATTLIKYITQYSKTNDPKLLSSTAHIWKYKDCFNDLSPEYISVLLNFISNEKQLFGFLSQIEASNPNLTANVTARVLRLLDNVNDEDHILKSSKLRSLLKRLESQNIEITEEAYKLACKLFAKYGNYSSIIELMPTVELDDSFIQCLLKLSRNFKDENIPGFDKKALLEFIHTIKGRIDNEITYGYLLEIIPDVELLKEEFSLMDEASTCSYLIGLSKINESLFLEQFLTRLHSLEMSDVRRVLNFGGVDRNKCLNAILKSLEESYTSNDIIEKLRMIPTIEEAQEYSVEI